MKKRVLKILIVLGSVLLGLVLVLLIAAEYTSRPNFCSTCHYMEPYVEAWKTSTHSGVTCTDCHYRPGLGPKITGKFTAISMTVNYFTGVYKKSKPWAEITDASCLRPGCHQERLLSGRVLFKEGILFDHAPHLMKLRRKKKLRCTSCHSQIVQGEHITVTESTCFLCHFKDQLEAAPIDNCTWCHDAPVKDESTEVKYDHSYVVKENIDCQKCHGPMQVGDGTVSLERCSSCHAEVGKIRKYDDTEFIHKNHVTDHKVECQSCHQVILHQSVSRTPSIMPECQSCHTKPHAVQLDLFSGQGGKNVPVHPNPMFEEGLNCQGCHIFHQFEDDFPEMGETVVARAESCEKCHGGGYVRILQQWKNLMARKVDLLRNAFTTVEADIGSSVVSEKAKQNALVMVNDARFNFELVEQGNFVHNVAYSDELLFSAHDYLTKALESAGSPTKIPDISVYSRLVPSECKNCHYGQEEIDVETFGITFSHNIHIEKNRLLCSKCHSNMRRHGELVMTRDECLSCHHTQHEVSCKKCHDVQAQLYSGIVDFATETIPDIMYEAGVECLACHRGTQRPVEKATPGKCVDCHDSDYGDILAEWQRATSNSLEELAKRLSGLPTELLSVNDRMRVDEISAVLQKIQRDKSVGAHNIQLIEETLLAYKDYLSQLPR